MHFYCEKYCFELNMMFQNPEWLSHKWLTENCHCVKCVKFWQFKLSNSPPSFTLLFQTKRCENNTKQTLQTIPSSDRSSHITHVRHWGIFLTKPLTTEFVMDPFFDSFQNPVSAQWGWEIGVVFQVTYPFTSSFVWSVVRLLHKLWNKHKINSHYTYPRE